ncbi:hypothetical protein [Nocardia aurantiaca]|nr:hypothetical protein [Nocardia aurantiaca]
MAEQLIFRLDLRNERFRVAAERWRDLAVSRTLCEKAQNPWV